MTGNGFVPYLLRNLIWILLVAVIAFFSLTTSSFLSLPNFINILFNASVLGVLVIGQTFTLLTGNFDLSAESTLGLCGLLGIWLITAAGTPYYGSGLMLAPWMAVPILLLAGALIGLANGWLVTAMKMNNFVVTLAMLIIVRGVTLVLNNGQTAYSVSAEYNWIGLGKMGPVSAPVVIMLLFFVAAHIVTTHLPFGRELYAIGANRNAARASGVRPERRILQVYVMGGLIAAFAGWMLSARLTNAMSSMGEGMIFEVFAAAVIGGVSLKGGQGTVLGALGGVLLLATINAGLNLMNVSVYWIQAIRGGIILVAMLIDAQKVRYVAPAARSAASRT
ncbi:MAG: ABC transporter permease [Caldilineaceae bacterium]|nr:ABC transporter permease [Caldilineaceae bacterium]